MTTAATHPDLFAAALRLARSSLGSQCERATDEGFERCREPVVGVQFDGGFLLGVCDHHGTESEGRGVLVLRPEGAAR